MEFITKSPNETKEVGKRFAVYLNKGKKSFVCASLVGDLGSGKTTFVQGVAQGLGIKRRIISPTFILVREYKLPKKLKSFKNFYHFDLYRLDQNLKEEVRNLGFLDLLGKDGNIVFVEWGEKIKDLLPKDSYWINFEYLSEKTRRISIIKI